MLDRLALKTDVGSNILMHPAVHYIEKLNKKSILLLHQHTLSK